MSKKILGLDIGTNSIGWALIDKAENAGEKDEILGMGSRIVPMDDNKEFESGQPVTRNATRRIARGSRKGNHRYKNRRNKLVYILEQLGLLPKYLEFGFESVDKETGEKVIINNQFPAAVKLQSLYLQPIKKGIKHLTTVENFELRVKALKDGIENEEFGKLLYQYNQKRGYAGGGADENKDAKTKSKENEDYKVEFKTLKILALNPIYKIESLETGKMIGRKKDTIEKQVYNLELLNLNDNSKFWAESYHEFIIEGEIKVLLNKRESNETYNFIIKENEKPKFAEPSAILQSIEIKPYFRALKKLFSL